MARNSHTEVTRKGFGRRLSDSIAGAIFGGLLFIASFPLLWWNEGRAIAEYRALKEGAGAVVQVASDTVDAANEGKLIHTSARVEGSPAVADPVLQVEVDGLALRRIVEMYQWKESSERHEKKKLGGGTETTTEYTYSMEWNDDRIDSSDFRLSEDHVNPTQWPVESASFDASDTRLGAFSLSGSARSAVGRWRQLDVAQAARFPEQFEGFRRIADSRLYLGDNPDKPRVGDVRIRYEFQPEEVFSIVARQTGQRLDSYTTSNGRGVLLVEAGEVAPAQMFEGAQKRNTIITWAVRLGGTLAMWIGLSMVFAPISRVLDVLPMLGTIGSWGIGLVTGLISLLLSVLTIAISWVFYRPLLGGVLIAAVVGLLLWSRRRQPAAPSTMRSTPPPPPPA